MSQQRQKGKLKKAKNSSLCLRYKTTVATRMVQKERKAKSFKVRKGKGSEFRNPSRASVK